MREDIVEPADAAREVIDFFSPRTSRWLDAGWAAAGLAAYAASWWQQQPRLDGAAGWWLALALLGAVLPVRLRPGGPLPLSLIGVAAAAPGGAAAALGIGLASQVVHIALYPGQAGSPARAAGLAMLSYASGVVSATSFALPPAGVALAAGMGTACYWAALAMLQDRTAEPDRRPETWYLRGLLAAAPLALGALVAGLLVAAAPAAGGAAVVAAVGGVGYVVVVRRLNALVAVADAHRKTVDALSTLTSGDDPFITGHPYRVSRYALAIGRRLRLSKAELDVLEYAALLHNLGALDSQWDLGNRPGVLTAEELERVRRAMAAGADIVARFGYYPRAADLVRHHLERYDGGGASRPLGARILSVANAFDAMLVRNRWRRSLTLEEALAELRAGAGSQFDPDAVAALIDAAEKDAEVRSLIDNPYQAPADRVTLFGRQPPRISPAAQAALTVQNTQLHARVEEVLRLLAATKSHTELVLDSLPDAVFTTDARGYITFLNRAACEMSGLTARSAAGRRFHEVFGPISGPPEHLQELRRLLDEPLAGSSAGYQAEVCLGVGDDAIPLRVHLGVLADRGEPLGGVGRMEDLRHWKRLEAQVKRAEKLAMLGELAAAVAHEVRNPLAIIRGYAECLPMDVTNPQALQESVDTILHEVDRLNRVISSVLAFARPSRIEPREVELNRELGRLLDGLQPQAEAQRVRIERDLKPLPPVRLDIEQLEQVFLNLAINALQAMPQGGCLRVETRAHGEGRVVVRFSDTGPGIPAELHDKIFQPFFTTKRQGTGLGLAISARIVEEHGGRIGVAAAEGGGTAFAVELPARRQAPAQRLQGPPQPAPEAMGAGAVRTFQPAEGCGWR